MSKYTAYELFDNFRDELTEEAIRFIETSDQIAIKDMGTYSSPQDFNKFVAELVEDDDDDIWTIRDLKKTLEHYNDDDEINIVLEKDNTFTRLTITAIGINPITKGMDIFVE